MIDKVRRSKHQRRGTIAPAFGQLIVGGLGIEQLQTLERERRPSTIAQQSKGT